MEFLPQQTQRVLGDAVSSEISILATGKKVVIIGGGDTGADCLGTCLRQAAASVRQFEIMPRPPETRSGLTPWPLWPLQLRTESSHEEGGTREWSLNTVRFEGDGDGNVARLQVVQVGPPPKLRADRGTETAIEADLVLLAMGFTGPVRNGMLEQLGVALDERGNVATDEQQHDFGGGRIRRRRHEAGTVAGGVGDCRGAQDRGRGECLSECGQVCPGVARLGRVRGCVRGCVQGCVQARRRPSGRLLSRPEAGAGANASSRPRSPRNDCAPAGIDCDLPTTWVGCTCSVWMRQGMDLRM